MKDKIIRILTVLITVTLIGFSSYKVLNVEDVSEYFLFNHKVVLNKGQQMEDTIKQYDFLIVENKDFKTIKEQDVIYYNISGSKMVHRVIELKKDGTLITQGDAQNYPNNFFVAEDDYYGKVRLVIKPYFLIVFPIMLLPSLTKRKK